MPVEPVILHPTQKHKVMLWRTDTEYFVLSYEGFWKDYAYEGFRRSPYEIKRRFPWVSRDVLDQHGGLPQTKIPFHTGYLRIRLSTYQLLCLFACSSASERLASRNPIIRRLPQRISMSKLQLNSAVFHWSRSSSDTFLIHEYLVPQEFKKQHETKNEAMGAFITLLFVYVLGGITFLPLVIGLILLHAYLWFPQVVDATGPPAEPPSLLPDPKEDGQDLGSVTGLSDFGGAFVRDREPDVAAGYFAVCREYVPGGVNGKPPERVTPVAAVAVTESPSVYQSMYKSIFDRSQSPTIESRKGSGKSAKRARNVFYVVLRHGHLMLYDDSEQVEVRHVVSLEHHDVSIYGGEEAIPESELWIKRNAICLTRKPGLEDGTVTSKPFYLFSENCSDKEDFYFALLQNQEVRPDGSGGPLRHQGFETKDIITLVQKLHSSEEQQQTRWLNALVGRLFLALYKSPEMEDFVRKKISKKIMRVKKPAFLTGIVLKKVGMGDSAPCITNPRLKDLTVDGDCCAEADVKYSGNFRLEIATTARLDLGTRFRAREVNLILAVVVRKLEGHALLKFKAPPSNRVWISFETMPDLKLEIEPIVSSRQITYGIILRTIESRIREVIAETIILPHWDDIPFTDTSGQHYRGGIWTQGFAESLSLPIPVEKDTPKKEDRKDIDIPSPSPLQGLTQPTDGESMSLPATPTSATPQLIPRKAATSALALADEEHVDALGQSTSTGAQKRSEPPKAIRSRSFASTAGPLVGMNHANVESAKIEKT
ncbi:MAG: hypothetical protein Q9214_003029, partial [Letrouitia sp. 1 TL-2023]